MVVDEIIEEFGFSRNRTVWKKMCCARAVEKDNTPPTDTRYGEARESRNEFRVICSGLSFCTNAVAGSCVLPSSKTFRASKFMTNHVFVINIGYGQVTDT